MVERRKPIVTELALADALDQLVNLIEELRADARETIYTATHGDGGRRGAGGGMTGRQLTQGHYLR